MIQLLKDDLIAFFSCYCFTSSPHKTQRYDISLKYKYKVYANKAKTHKNYARLEYGTWLWKYREVRSNNQTGLSSGTDGFWKWRSHREATA